MLCKFLLFHEITKMFECFDNKWAFCDVVSVGSFVFSIFIMIFWWVVISRILCHVISHLSVVRMIFSIFWFVRCARKEKVSEAIHPNEHTIHKFSASFLLFCWFACRASVVPFFLPDDFCFWRIRRVQYFATNGITFGLLIVAYVTSTHDHLKRMTIWAQICESINEMIFYVHITPFFSFFSSPQHFVLLFCFICRRSLTLVIYLFSYLFRLYVRILASSCPLFIISVRPRSFFFSQNLCSRPQNSVRSRYRGFLLFENCLFYHSLMIVPDSALQWQFHPNCWWEYVFLLNSTVIPIKRFFCHRR